MKLLPYFLILLITISCKKSVESSQILSDYMWRDVLALSSVMSSKDSRNIFFEYDNIKMRNFIKDMYLGSDSIVGYEASDSVLRKIESRINTKITNQLDTMFNSKFKFITDTTAGKDGYLIFSEPIYITKDLFVLSIREIASKENYKNQWFFFFNRKNDKLDLVNYYDWDLNMFYKKAEW